MGESKVTVIEIVIRNKVGKLIEIEELEELEKEEEKYRKILL